MPIDMVMEDKKQEALDAGGDLQEVDSLAAKAPTEEYAPVPTGTEQDSAEVEESMSLSLDDVEPLEPAERYQQRLSVEYSAEAASEEAAYAALLSGSAAPEQEYELMVRQLTQTGSSDGVARAESLAAEENIKNDVVAAGKLVSDPNVPQEAKQLIIENLKAKVEAPEVVDVADEVTMRIADSAVADATSENDAIIALKHPTALQQRLSESAKFEGLLAEQADEAFNWTAQTGLDFMGTLVGINDSVSYYELLDELGIKFNAATTLVPGEMLTEVRSHLAGLSPEKRYEAALSIQEFLNQNAGILGVNKVKALQMMSSVFNDYAGGDPDSIDWDRWFADAGPMLDLLTLGTFQVVKNAVSAPLKAAKLSRLNRAISANPKVASNLVEDAMLKPKIAEMLGETSGSLVLKHTVPKVEGWKEASSPSMITDVIEEAKAIVDEARLTEEAVLASRGKSVAVKEQEALVNTARGHNAWIADTEIVGGVGKPWTARVLLGKNAGYGFAKKEEAQALLTTAYKGQGVLLSRTNRIDGVEEVVEKGQEAAKATEQVIRELTGAKATKLPVGEEKALRKELAGLKAEVKSRKKEIPSGASGTKATQQAAIDAVKASNRAVEPLEREIAEIEGLLDQSTKGARAEREISRLQAGHLDKLEAPTKARLEQLTKDKIAVAAKDPSEALEWFIKVEHKGDIAFADDAVRTSLFAEKGSWAFDADTILSKNISQLSNAVFDKWKFIEKEMLSYLDSFAKLSEKEQLALSRILSKGNDEETLFDPATLRRLGFSDAAQTAYVDFRKAMDIAFVLENKVHRESLVVENMKHVSKGDYNTFARPLTAEQAKDVKLVFDPTTKTIVKVDAASAYANGKQIGKLRGTEFVDNVGATHILLDATDIAPLPVNTLRKYVGWVPQTNKSNYFITKTTDVVVDGKDVTREVTVGVSHSLTDAQSRVKSLQASAPKGVKFGQKHDRTLTADRDYAQNVHDLYSVSGGLFYGKRGDRLKNSLGEVSTIADPLEAAVKAITRLSHDVTMKPYINDLKSRFVATYNDLLRDKGVFPATVDDIHLAEQLADPRVVKAKAMYRQIDLLDNLDSQANFRQTAIIMADYAERNLGIVGKGIAWGFRNVSETNPVGWLRARNYELNLATNPIAQLLVQPSQTLNMLALSGRHFIQDFRRGWSVSKLATKRADLVYTDAELASTARSLDMSVEELRADIKSFRRSGGTAAITSHETARDAASPISSKLHGGMVKKTVSTVTTPVSKTVKFLGKGFERGEAINIGAHWQVAKRRWMEAHPGVSPYTNEAEFAIAGEARSLSLSMTQAGNLSYQRGIAALPTQYAAVQHKQLMLMTTTQALTGAEKRKVAAVQLAAWGPAGLGLGWIVQQGAGAAGVDLTDGWSKALTAGVVEWSFNNILSMVTREEVDLDFSARFAAASGLNDNIATTIGEMLIDGELSDLYALILGPTVSNFNRFSTAATTIQNIYDTKSRGYEDVAMGVDAVLSVMSSYNNFSKAKLYENSGWWTDAKGNPLFKPNDVELIFKAAIGLNPSKVEQFYSAKDRKLNREKDLQEVADDYYAHILNLSARFSEESAGLGDSAWASLKTKYDQEVKINNAIIQAHGEDAPEIMAKVQRTIEKNHSVVGFDALTDSLSKMVIGSGRSNDAKALVQEGVNAGFISADVVEQNEKFISTLLGEEK